ncbi:MAG TPA: ribosome biogenesis GTP-binding protein YihA/YsxC [Burkholderiaceae bacterium]|nr:ribosome biogenesis GTP-binding protein YihA/YsxC [Burkholderiaceae bacterium]
MSSLLHRARFYSTAASLAQLDGPGFNDDIPEVAFVGRSNAGKSTAINLLCNQRGLAFASKTPGRTQLLNFFLVADRDRSWGYLVDLPGYGYAASSGTTRAGWDALLGGYLRERRQLVGVVLLMDSRRGLTELDERLIDWVTPAQKPIHVLLTKTDKLNRTETRRALEGIQRALEGSPHTVQTFSALHRTGLEDADARVLQWFGAPPTAWPKKKPQ